MEWLEDVVEWFLDIGWVFIVAVVLFGGLAFAIRQDTRQRHAACAQAWSLARDHRDSLDVIGMCELPRRQNITPVPIIIPVR